MTCVEPPLPLIARFGTNHTYNAYFNVEREIHFNYLHHKNIVIDDINCA